MRFGMPRPSITPLKTERENPQPIGLGVAVLQVQGFSGGTDSGFAGLLDVPFVKTGDTHGDTLPAEGHTAGDIGFSAHVESMCFRE